jgi:hypothetical protein
LAGRSSSLSESAGLTDDLRLAGETDTDLDLEDEALGAVALGSALGSTLGAGLIGSGSGLDSSLTGARAGAAKCLLVVGRAFGGGGLLLSVESTSLAYRALRGSALFYAFAAACHSRRLLDHHLLIRAPISSLAKNRDTHIPIVTGSAFVPFPEDEVAAVSLRTGAFPPNLCQFKSRGCPTHVVPQVAASRGRGLLARSRRVALLASLAGRGGRWHGGMGEWRGGC